MQRTLRAPRFACALVPLMPKPLDGSFGRPLAREFSPCLRYRRASTITSLSTTAARRRPTGRCSCHPSLRSGLRFASPHCAPPGGLRPPLRLGVHLNARHVRRHQPNNRETPLGTVHTAIDRTETALRTGAPPSSSRALTAAPTRRPAREKFDHSLGVAFTWVVLDPWP